MKCGKFFVYIETYRTKFHYLICCTRSTVDGLINIEEMRYKTLLFFIRIHLQGKHVLVAPFLPHSVLFIVNEIWSA